MTTDDSSAKDQTESEPAKDTSTPQKIGFGSILLSTLAAAVGVQNKKALEKDFSNSSPIPFIVAGILFTAVFMGTIIVIAKIAVSD
ncbi:MAG: hypothetical protein COA42_20760 [Alteromonadaceae bacterium]|nr:MAG: hypothetical protein COA42_20760 [Alteromonadaceae bacterium]